MLLRMAFFLTTVTVVTALAHWFLANRLARSLRPPGRRLVYGLAALSAVAMPLLIGGSRALFADAPGSTLAMLAFVHLGFFSLLYASVLSWEIVRGVALLGNRLFRHPEGEGPLDRVLPVDPERRRALLGGLNLSLVGLAGAQSAAAVVGNQDPQVVEVEVPVPALHPDLVGLRIVQLSDVHVGPMISGDFVRQVVDVVNTLDADLVAITGDLVDGSVAELREHTAPLASLKSRLGTFFSTGNHEYYSGAEAWCDECERLGMSVLNNRHEVIRRGGAELVVAGVTDLRAGRILPAHEHDLDKAMAGAPAGDFRLLLAHQPRSVLQAPRHQIDLQLSGHTHGGQYFPGTLLIHLAHPYVKDLNLHEGRTWIYVSCGTGFWGPPFRLGTRAEITLLRLVAA